MIEEQLYAHLLGNEKLAAMLTTYKTIPAIFLQEVPPDTDLEWKRCPQYGRVVFGLDMVDDPERHVSGTLWVDAYCKKDNFSPEEVAPVIIEALDNYFFSDQEETIAVSWRSTEVFVKNMIPTRDNYVNGVTLIFDVLAFSKQTTNVVPDVIKGMYDYLSELASDAYLLAYDDSLPPIFRSTDLRPAIYVRLMNNKADLRKTYATAWLSCSMSVHVITPAPNVRETILQRFMHRLALDAEIVLSDKSPFIIQQLSTNFSVNPLFDGQMTVEGRYRVNPIQPDIKPMDSIHLDYKLHD